MKGRKRWVVTVDGEPKSKVRHANQSQAAVEANALIRDGVAGVKVEKR